MKQKNQAIDIIRASAILMVIFHHLYAYIPIERLWIVSADSIHFCMHIFRYLALSMFCFISGILLSNSFCKYNTMSYLFHRYLRIFPLYYIAIVLFIAIVGIDTLTPFTWEAVLFHLFGLQILLRNTNCEPMLTLWYIGLVLYFDLFLIVAAYLSKRNVKPLVVAMLTIVFWFILRFFFQIGDHRFLIYFPIFLMGFFFSHLQVLLKRKNVSYILFFLFVSSLLAYKHFFFRILSSDLVDNYSLFSFFSLFSLFNVLGIMITFVLFVYIFFSNNPIKHDFLISKVAYASYAVYLFHRPLLQIYLSIPLLKSFELANYLIIPPMMIFIGYEIQKLYQYIVDKVLMKDYK